MKEILDMLKMSFTGIVVDKGDGKQLLQKEKIYSQEHDYRWEAMLSVNH